MRSSVVARSVPRLLVGLLAAFLALATVAVSAPAPARAAVPTVSAVSPSMGSISGNTLVTISGSGLTDATAVAFGGATGTDLVVVSDSQLRVRTPAHAAGSLTVSVTTPEGTAERLNGFSYYIPSPSLESVTPSTGPPEGGTLVTVTGTNLTHVTLVKFGGIDGTDLAIDSDTQLRVRTPAHATGYVDVGVFSAGGGGSWGDAFVYVSGQEPVVRDLAPRSGSIRGGTLVTVGGINLSDATAVTFDGVPGTDLAVGAEGTNLQVRSPAHAMGSVAVAVTTPYGAFSKPSGFNYVIPMPVINEVAPAAGPTAGGMLVTLTGSDLTSVTSVKFGGYNGTPGTDLRVASDTRVVVRAPAHSAGLVSLWVQTPVSGQSVFDAYTYVADWPSISDVFPADGPTAGGTTVTLTGTNLATATEVSFGGALGSNLVPVSDTELSVQAPAHAAGRVPVDVKTLVGAFTFEDGFEYLAPPPSITSVSPESGPTTGDALVTLTGTDLSGATSVTFDGTEGTSVEPLSDTQVRVRTPAHSAGAVPVAVTTPGGTATLPDGFTYENPPAPAPTITSVSPDLGTTAGGTRITVTGTNLADVTAVRFGGTAGTAVEPLSDTQVQVRTPAHAVGPVAVQVVTPAGTASRASAFRYYTAPPATLAPVERTPTSARYQLPVLLPGATVTVGAKAAGVHGVIVTDGRIDVSFQADFSGNVSQPITVAEGGRTYQVALTTQVKPLPVTHVRYTLRSQGRSLISWQLSGNATGYTVTVAGTSECSVTASWCVVPKVLGPKAQVKVRADGGSGTSSSWVNGAYLRDHDPVDIASLQFAADSADLRAGDQQALRQAARVVAEQGFAVTTTHGFVRSNDTGSATVLAQLARRRAVAVKEFLLAQFEEREVTVWVNNAAETGRHARGGSVTIH